MGLRPGAPVTLVSKGWRGGSIVAAVGESRVALGRGMAEKVWLRRMR
jgi:Fe2+ transport system protein FeoA